MRKGLIFGAVVTACTVGAGAYVALAAQESRRTPTAADVRVASSKFSLGAITKGKPYVVYRHISRADESRYGMVAVAPLDHPNASRVIPGLVCGRVYFARGGGLCLEPAGVVGASLNAWILGPDLKPRGSVKLSGLPTRTRIAPQGRLGAATVFIAGHSYAEPGKFSTATTLIDLARRRKIANIETFEVTRNGERFRSLDFNFWGVTFANDGNRFYATLASRGKTYLVRGSVSSRKLEVLHENVECPALSPDGTRIAYKKRTGSGASWRLSVLDLRTMNEHALAETRPVDDQAEWLDNRRVLYGLDRNVWVVAADGSGSPRKLIPDADSPAVVR
jgi:hypothetical protein